MVGTTTANIAQSPRRPSRPVRALNFAQPIIHPARRIALWDRIPPHLLSRIEWDQGRFAQLQDPLTLLPNRAAFQALLDAYIKCETAVSLLIIDLDGFKDVNDTFGHDAGDEVLRGIANALLQMVYPWEVVARIGGDEFAIILPNLTSAAAMKCAMERYQAALENPPGGMKGGMAIRASLGGALYPRQGASRAELMQFADIALYEAKRLGGDRAEIFRQSMLEAVQFKHATRLRAFNCVQRSDSLLVYYQPKIDLRTEALVGYEALIRCLDQTGRVHGPSWISAAFEDPALSLTIGQRVRRECFESMKSLINSDNSPSIALNVTPWELRTPGWAETFLQDAAAAGVPLPAIEVEVTESVVLSDRNTNTLNALELLHAQGITITLDDFGTGFASLSHLRSCPIDSLKIDRSFIRNLSQDDAAAIVKAMIGLGQSLDMIVVAEGIEKIEQHELLRDWGCHHGQGFLYGHAIPLQASFQTAKVGS